jgi:UDP-glucuronate decarboxylase
MKILVAGGAGFIGSHLCDQLIKEKHEVVILDNLHTGSLENIEHLLVRREVEFIQGDVADPINIKVDGIYNLASPASPVHYQTDPVSTIRSNIIGSYNLLKLATELKVRIVQASTSEVYGDPLVSPQVESYWGNVNPIGIRSCYDEGKRAAETLFFDFYRQYSTDIGVARIFNTYGPRMRFDDGRVVSNFIFQSLQNKALTIYGDGTQTRSFCYVSDLVRGLILLFERSDCRGPINFGNPNPVSMIQLANKILNATSSKSSFEMLPLPEDDPKKREPSIDRATAELSWLPSVDLDQGIDFTVADFKSRLFKSNLK